ncbi:MAG: hypothetical protein N2D54_01460 [Chloroflexota bacterium]
MAKKKQLDWMMWRVEDEQVDDPPALNLIRAIQYYNEKYGAVPNRCEVSPKWGKDLLAPEGMLVTKSRSVRPGHLMLAIDPEIPSSLPIK